jgi:hypothetical protein
MRLDEFLKQSTAETDQEDRYSWHFSATPRDK